MKAHSRYSRSFLRHVGARSPAEPRPVWMDNTDLIRSSIVKQISVQAQALEHNDPEPNEWKLILQILSGTTCALSIRQADPGGGTLIVCNSHTPETTRLQRRTVSLDVRRCISVNECIDDLAQAGILRYKLKTDGSGELDHP